MEIKYDILGIIEDGDLSSFLRGSKYELRESFASMPTNISEVLMHINYANKKDPQSIDKFEKSLESWVLDEKYGGWLVLNYIYSYVFKKNRGIIDFEITLEPILSIVRDKLVKEKDFLMDNTDWVGSNYNLGLWGHVLNLNSLLKEEIGVSLIPHE